ncbi:hypothetical protein HPNQ4216_0672 [Helicobacter pylori NQ4216]|nr:hypothetical protein HPNQ4216_0672 [Helicobacter pylori NQ4216]
MWVLSASFFLYWLNLSLSLGLYKIMLETLTKQANIFYSIYFKDKQT